MDVLTDWVHLTGPSGALLAKSRLQAPWGMALAAGPETMFHMMLEGECWLRLADSAPLHLALGDVVLLPGGPAHELVHAPKGKAEPLAQLLARKPPTLIEGPASTVLCGTYRFETPLAQQLLRGLPRLVHLTAAQVRSNPSLAKALSLITGEVEQPGPGSEWLFSHLFDTVLVYLVRTWSTQADAQTTGWLSALRDASLARVLSRMHASPQSRWTVETLAREANLSRAAFARRFTEQVGEAPLAYLTRWRMGFAARLLRNTDAPLAEIAARVGYDSEFSFSRAFKRSLGKAPSVFRRASSQA
jgi:AraC family transcriptional activator of mtrCDE